jgi:MFS family permease
MSPTAEAVWHSARDYAARLRLFRPNARLYLLNVVVAGAAMGVFRLIFNFYVLSRGFDEALLGNLVTVNSFTSLLVALPIGYLADVLGRKRSLVISGAVTALSIVMMVLFPTTAMLFAANILFGVSQSLAAVTNSPFLMENSGEAERTYLFSFSMGLQMASQSVGNWLGGVMPGWVASAQGIDPMSSQAYGGALLVIAGIQAVALVPLFLLRMPRLAKAQRSVFAPVSYAREHPKLLGKLIAPILITSIGAGLIMPFMNVFFRHQYGQSDPAIGALFAWGSLSMGLGLIIAPPLAERMGKIQLVVITQALSIPFLVLLGFSPWFWLSVVAYLVRVALMNMSSPIYQTFVMEKVDSSARATVASLVSMSWNFGWAFSPMISGWLQVRHGFAPPFILTIVLYAISVALYWAFFWKGSKE